MWNLWLQKKKYDNKFFFAPLFCCCFWIRDPRWVKIRIRDKHPGSATLVPSSYYFPTMKSISWFLTSFTDSKQDRISESPSAGPSRKSRPRGRRAASGQAAGSRADLSEDEDDDVIVLLPAASVITSNRWDQFSVSYRICISLTDRIWSISKSPDSLYCFL